MRSLLLVLLLLLPSLAPAQMYRWVDGNGKVHYSDQAPPAGAKDVRQRPMSSGRGSSAPLPYALEQAVRDYPVTLYTSELCKEPCAQARELLKQRGVPYREVGVSTESDLARLKALSGGNAVPVMTVGSEVYKGFDRSTYNGALDIGLYPKSSLLPPGAQVRQVVAKPPAKTPPAAAEAGPATAEAPAPPSSK